ncbi:hypothetical protein RF11_15056 [Thelohanellus kitauei]|uniref:Integrin beta subunit VWA domain-containing protein n=1 Tax=Thelohanellus kitauei TaxID=669202 RepID=A0A0C2MHK9_THEKT|nr:hypothetical protein RF11_15056 [Thelohanellus kitauei]
MFHKVILVIHCISIQTWLPKNQCFDFDTCDTCIMDPLCMWVTKMDDYIRSPDTQKGMRHCVLRESKTLFKPEDVYQSQPSIKRSNPLYSKELIIDPYMIKISSGAADEIRFDVTVTPRKANRLNIYFLIHRTTSLKDFFGIISSNLDGLYADLTKPFHFPRTKMGIGEFVDVPYFPFVRAPFSKGNKSWDDDFETTRLMIVVTDISSKRAGHGDIIGLFHPSEGQCKIINDENVANTDTDYIHPHLLGDILMKRKIRVLFLTHKSHIKHYEVCEFYNN